MVQAPGFSCFSENTPRRNRTVIGMAGDTKAHSCEKRVRVIGGAAGSYRKRGVSEIRRSRKERAASKPARS